MWFSRPKRWRTFQQRSRKSLAANWPMRCARSYVDLPVTACPKPVSSMVSAQSPFLFKIILSLSVPWGYNPMLLSGMRLCEVLASLLTRVSASGSCAVLQLCKGLCGEQ